MDYKDFLQQKQVIKKPTGINIPREQLNPVLFDFQLDIVHWCLNRGKSAIFADCGLGKTLMQLEWAYHINKQENIPILILTPLAVAPQTKKIANEKMNIDNVKICHSKDDIINGINLANYEKLHKFNANDFVGIVLDESSILKSFTGKYRTDIINNFKDTPFKLACTATPAPNDFMELGNHSEFLNVLSRTEMLTTFFVHDGGETSKWRLKGHAEDKFWEWLGSWCVMMRQPSDLGYSNQGFELPSLNIHEIVVDVENIQTDTLFPVEAHTLQERQKERKETINKRVSACADLINNSNDTWLVWCNLNEESDKLTKSINNAVEIKGSHKQEYKESKMMDFSDNKINTLVSKPRICGFGMNWQHCSKMAFVGLSDSYEQYYQAVRRCWRFGQEKEVDVYIITAETEGAVVKNIQAKERKSKEMAQGIIDKMHIINEKNIHDYKHSDNVYIEDVKKNDNHYTLYKGDCVEITKNMPDNSIHFSIFSPPFADLYTYSNNDRDMGNSVNYEDFFNHFKYLIPELYRITMPGRLVAFHCMNLPISKQREGYIGIRDFRGELIRAFQSSNWIYHSEVCIWKDPVIAMQRTKALGLLHKQIKKDSAMCRQGIADYLVVMRKHGDNPERVEHTNETFPVKVWQQYASPIWTDINPSNTLQKTSAREHKDERHICPLQLEVIKRAVELWTNPNDIVFTPFMGIGSECYQSLLMGRRAIGVELKQSYYNQAVLNCEHAVEKINEELLF